MNNISSKINRLLKYSRLLLCFLPICFLTISLSSCGYSNPYVKNIVEISETELGSLYTYDVMIELPEAAVLSKQLSNELSGKEIVEVIAAQNPHKFAWYSGDPALYYVYLTQKQIEGAVSYGGQVELWAGDICRSGAREIHRAGRRG